MAYVNKSTWNKKTKAETEKDKDRARQDVTEAPPLKCKSQGVEQNIPRELFQIRGWKQGLDRGLNNGLDRGTDRGLDTRPKRALD